MPKWPFWHFDTAAICLHFFLVESDRFAQHCSISSRDVQTLCTSYRFAVCVRIVSTKVAWSIFMIVCSFPRAYQIVCVWYLPNVSLTDQNTGMMNWFGQSQFEDLGLETTLQEIFDFQTQHVIEFHVLFVQHTNTNQTTQQSVTCGKNKTYKLAWNISNGSVH